MKKEYFEILVLLLKVGLIVLSVYIVPSAKKFLDANVSKEQKEQAKFWTLMAVKFAETIYKEKGQGKLKKEWVLEWLNRNKITISKEQADILIDTIVKEFNKNGWDTGIINKVEN